MPSRAQLTSKGTHANTHTHTHTHAHTLTRVSGHREKQNQARQATTHRTNKERLRDSKNRKDKKKATNTRKKNEHKSNTRETCSVAFFLHLCVWV